jgi:replicative superfamily II helicase
MIQCPLRDVFCPYYKNGNCTLKNCEKICGAFFTRDEDEKAKEEEEEIEDKYTLDDLGNNWY